MNEKVISINI